MSVVSEQNVPALRFPGFEGEWQDTELGSQIDLLTGYPFESDLYSENKKDIRLLRGDNVVQGSIRWENARLWPKSKCDGLERYQLSEKDFVIALDRTWVRSGIKAATIRLEDLPCFLVQRVARIRALPALDQGFMTAVFQSHRFETMVKTSKTETAVPHISPRDIREFKAHLPNLAEQEKIATFLGEVDEKIGGLEKKRVLLEDYKRGLMQKLFSRQLRFKDEQGHDFPDWEKGTLDSIAKVIGGGTPESGNDDFWGEDIQWFTPSEVGAKYVGRSKRQISKSGLKNSSAKLLPPGALLLATRATVGVVSIAKEACTTNQGFQSLVVGSQHVNEFWYYWILQHENEFLRRASGSTFLEIPKSEVSKIPVEIPSLAEQQKIANFLAAVDDQIGVVTSEVAETKTFKKGLLQKMFV